MAYASSKGTSWDTLFSRWLSSSEEYLELEVDNYSCGFRWERQEIIVSVNMGFGYQDNPALMDGLLMLSIPSLSFFKGALAIDPSTDCFCIVSILSGDVKTNEIIRELESLLNQCDVWCDQLAIRPYYQSASNARSGGYLSSSIHSLGRQFSLSNL